MLESFTFWLTVLGTLVGYLCVSIGLRWHREKAERRSRELPGKGFDVSTIAPQIRQVQQDQLGVLRARGHSNPYRTRLLAVARCLIAGLPFFSRDRSGREIREHNN